MPVGWYGKVLSGVKFGSKVKAGENLGFQNGWVTPRYNVGGNVFFPAMASTHGRIRLRNSASSQLIYVLDGINMIPHTNTKLIALLVATLPLAVVAQISYTGGIYTQDFDTLQSGSIYTPYTNFPAGWTIWTANPYSSGSYVWATVTNGYSNNYGEYCFSSSASDPDKSIGLIIGSTGQAYLGAQFRNQTGVRLTSFSLSYVAKQWVKGLVTSNDQVIPFAYSLDATNLTSGTWVKSITIEKQ
jgi:hypothetical protein